jgi:hypothetical protein
LIASISPILHILNEYVVTFPSLSLSLSPQVNGNRANTCDERKVRGDRSRPCILPRGFVHDVDVFDSCVVVHTRESTRRGFLRLDRVVGGPETGSRVDLSWPVRLALPDWAVTVDTGRNELYKGQNVYMCAREGAGCHVFSSADVRVPVRVCGCCSCVIYFSRSF